MKRKILVSKIFTRLTVTGQFYKNGKAICNCTCDCGNYCQVCAGDLIQQKVLSCGCLKNELAANRVTLRNTKHNLSTTKSYRAWWGMMGRCYRKTATGYKNYGGRGIVVEKSWHTFENFYADMGEPASNLTLDRIDNNKNYCKENCRWATYIEQANNRRNNVKITFKNKNQTISQWAKELGISRKIIPKILGVANDF